MRATIGRKVKFTEEDTGADISSVSTVALAAPAYDGNVGKSRSLRNLANTINRPISTEVLHTCTRRFRSRDLRNSIAVLDEEAEPSFDLDSDRCAPSSPELAPRLLMQMTIMYARK